MNGIGHAKQIQPFKPITEIEFCSWLGQAQPDDILEYHQGFLALDRCVVGTAEQIARARALHQVAERAFELAERGFIHLIQRRLGPDEFSYLAIARPQPDGAVLTFATLMPEEAEEALQTHLPTFHEQ